MHQDNVYSIISAPFGGCHCKKVALNKSQFTDKLIQVSLRLFCSCIEVWILPDIVVALDVNFVKDPFWGLQEILFHLHGYVPGQQTH